MDDWFLDFAPGMGEKEREQRISKLTKLYEKTKKYDQLKITKKKHRLFKRILEADDKETQKLIDRNKNEYKISVYTLNRDLYKVTYSNSRISSEEIKQSLVQEWKLMFHL